MKRILLVGGDERALRMVPLLEAAGYNVKTLGLHTEDEKSAETGMADALLFPYPFAVRNGSVPTLTGLTLYAEDVLHAARENVVVLAGNGIEPYLKSAIAMGKQPKVLYYMSQDGFSQMNAELSAEASVYEAMRMLPEALMDMTVLVVGYGRFGRALAKRLLALDADVWVAARREEQRLLAASDGMRAIAMEAMGDVAPHIRILLNTVPAHVVGEDTLQGMQKDACLMELASAPYGFDREAAERLNLHCEVLPALPARYAPQSAAKALAQAILRLLSEAVT